MIVYARSFSGLLSRRTRTGAALTAPKWGSVGILGRQLWSFAGDSDQKDVNQTLIEPFLNYNLDKGWFLLTDIVMTANRKEGRQQEPLDNTPGWWFWSCV
jgi:hypothetical protein